MMGLVPSMQKWKNCTSDMYLDPKLMKDDFTGEKRCGAHMSAKVSQLDEVEPKPIKPNPQLTKRTMMSFMQIPDFLMFAHKQMPPNEALPFHIHDDAYEMHFILEGTGTMTYENPEKTKNITLEVGPETMVTVPPGLWHEPRAGPGGMKMLYFAKVVDKCFWGETSTKKEL